MTVLKLFLPSWRFFENFSQVPELQARFRLNSGELSDWRTFPPRFESQRGWRRIFFNPETNFELLCRSLVDRFISQREVGKETAEILEKMILNFATQNTLAFQYRILLRSSVDTQEIYLSPVIKL